MAQRVLQVHPKDNVLVALKNLSKGEEITFNGKVYRLQDDIAAKHNFLCRICRRATALSCTVCW